MRVVLITQDSPLYLTDAVEMLLNNVPRKFSIIACVILEASPFGKKKNILSKISSTIRIFGFRFFTYYLLIFLYSKIFKKSLKTILKSKGINPILLEESINNETSLEVIKAFKPDVLVSIAGNQIFKKSLIELAPKGCLNLHTGMLPKYRGLMPTFWALKNNEKEVGVSVFFVDEGIDSGPIICQASVNVENRSHRELIKVTKEVGIKCVIDAMQQVDDGNTFMIDNDDSQSTYFGFPTRNDVKEFKKSGARFF